MPKIRTILFLLLLGGLVWFLYGDDYKQTGLSGVWGEIKDDIQHIKESDAVQQMQLGLENLLHYVTDKEEVPPTPDIEAPDLHQPTEQTFSVHNIEIHDQKSTVEEDLNHAKRHSMNDYGIDWYTYHEHYHHFVMVAYDKNDQVVGLFTNQDLISSTVDITLETDKRTVREQFGDPLQAIQKGLVKYRIDDNDDQDTYVIDNNYITFFYDVHQDNQVAAIQIIAKELEDDKTDYFASPSKQLTEGLEYQLFDLTNAARVKFGKTVLEWYEPARLTAQHHSEDMAENNYFGHTNLAGLSPFDRLKEDDISFQMAGENLATGQASSIYAHQGLMNSAGHRENILKDEFRLMTVGVAFQDNGQPFYTENYLTK
ncbi:CAP-associated domain-containing protein [Gracilibacillus sp. S3-1-1]|uniref:CAP-associated domain-containing protein n=1 Tax=Gracilibacillus pellucidus TaxID=3095368 RepID=A0ACC6M5F9_9BACI|nr:CAP-associated domain-containing protein [Gracilibacillus sp. S3-1-1]MDX8046210.1 CAP-associated domain-containing protein [Gracilibacillus sp. S3-1-1]